MFQMVRQARQEPCLQMADFQGGDESETQNVHFFSAHTMVRIHLRQFPICSASGGGGRKNHHCLPSPTHKRLEGLAPWSKTFTSIRDDDQKGWSMTLGMAQAILKVGKIESVLNFRTGQMFVEKCTGEKMGTWGDIMRGRCWENWVGWKKAAGLHSHRDPLAETRLDCWSKLLRHCSIFATTAISNHFDILMSNYQINPVGSRRLFLKRRLFLPGGLGTDHTQGIARLVSTAL